MTTFPDYLLSHFKVLDNAKLSNQILRLQQALEDSVTQSRTVYVFGNGGSSSTADHFASDLSQLMKRIGVRLRAESLNTSLSLGSALSNDLEYQEVIAYELELRANEKDIAIGITASGKSENVLRGLKASRRLGMQTFAFVGFDGGKVIEMSNVDCIHFNTPQDYGLVENLHLCLCHYLTDCLISVFGKKSDY